MTRPTLTGSTATQPSTVQTALLAHRLVLSVALSVGLAFYHVAGIVTFGLGHINGALYPLVDDDVMISMRFGRNLVRGLGLVYNPGERVEGFTNPLFTLITAGLHLLPVAPRLLPGVIMAMNLGISLAILWLLLRVWGTSDSGRVAGLFAGLFYVLLPHHAWEAHAGYEVYLQMVILLYSVWRAERMRPVDALVLGLLPLTHGTALVMWGVLWLATMFFARASWRRAATLGVLAAIPFVAYEAFRLSFYGQSLPNTYWLKAGAGSLQGGASYAARWLLVVAPIALLGAYGALRALTPMRALMAILILVHTASVVALGGDILPEFRFLMPCSLLLAALAGSGAAEWLAGGEALLEGRELAGGRRPGWMGLRAVALAGIGVATLAITVVQWHRHAPAFEAEQHWNIRHIAAGLAVQENTPPDAVIALFGLGFTGYFGDRFTIDMLGKADYHIARLRPVQGRPIGHNKSDVAYVLDRVPAYVELDLSPSRLADVPWLTEQQRTDKYGYTFDLALSPAFRGRYAVRLADARGRRVPFAVRGDVPSTPWSMPDAFYANLEAWQE